MAGLGLGTADEGAMRWAAEEEESIKQEKQARVGEWLMGTLETLARDEFCHNMLKFTLFPIDS